MKAPSKFLSSLSSPIEENDVLVNNNSDSRVDTPWKVVLFNDDIHSFEEVIVQVQKATGYGLERAEKVAFEAHTKGKALAFSGSFARCFGVAGKLREIQLIVEIEG